MGRSRQEIPVGDPPPLACRCCQVRAARRWPYCSEDCELAFDGVGDPTPQEIADRAAAVRSGWDGTADIRPSLFPRYVAAEPYAVPRVALNDLFPDISPFRDPHECD